MALPVEFWNSDYPRHPELTALVARLGQEDWVAFKADWHLANHMLIALSDGEVVGFLRYVVQEIGVEDHPRQGIGRALQERLIDEARAAGLYQIRSHSSAKNTENHRLKLSLGYGIHPLVASRGKDGAYCILPLRTTSQEHHE